MAYVHCSGIDQTVKMRWILIKHNNKISCEGKYDQNKKTHRTKMRKKHSLWANENGIACYALFHHFPVVRNVGERMAICCAFAMFYVTFPLKHTHSAFTRSLSFFFSSVYTEYYMAKCNIMNTYLLGKLTTTKPTAQQLPKSTQLKAAQRPGPF